MLIQSEFLARNYDYDTFIICENAEQARVAIEAAFSADNGKLMRYFALAHDPREVYVYSPEVTLRGGEHTVLQVQEPSFSQQPRSLSLVDNVFWQFANSSQAIFPLYVLTLENYRLSDSVREFIAQDGY